jgi:hypothetical protein
MSIKLIPVIVCDGCGTVIETDYHIQIHPQNQEVVQRDPARSSQRDFCCEACEEWWYAQYGGDGPWGPAWDEREWWCAIFGPCAEKAHVRTTHDESPLVDVRVHFDSPERFP